MKMLRVHAGLRELPVTVVSTFLATGVPQEFGERLLPMLRRRKLAEFAEISTTWV